MRCTPILTVIAAGLMLGACADFYSISRKTSLPDNPTSNQGLAIHLDAQQRLMMVGKDGTYCAEASPDAMAAYAAALAASASAQGYGSGSASNASQSNIASIGLRTQSITLMRDALYRLCEAGANGQVSKISATQLMARSQDLTAVVVAVEQLTGSTAASQALLTGTSSANAAASAIGGADQLDAANKNLERKQEAVARAESDLQAKGLEVDTQNGVATTAKSAADNPPDDASEAQKQTLRSKSDAEDIKLATLTREQKNLQTRVSNAKEAESRAQDIVDKVASTGSATDSTTSAATSGAGQFATNQSRDNVNDTSSQYIAKSVEAMVTTVLNKDYTGADCMVLLTNITTVEVDADHKDLLDNTLRQCAELLATKIEAEKNGYLVGQAVEDANTARLDAALDADPTFEAKLWKFIDDHAKGAPMTNFLTHDRFAQLRQQAVTELLP